MRGPRRALRVLVEWPGLPGYAVACVEALRARHAVETLVLYSSPDDHARFSPTRLQRVGPVVDVTRETRAELAAHVRRLRPAGALGSGWPPRARAVAQAARGVGARTVSMVDNTGWPSPLRRRLFRLAHPLTLGRLFDRYLVPGERSRRYLRAGGVAAGRIWTGLYAASRPEPVSRDPWPDRFVFVGQYVERKGVADLLEAFARVGGDWQLQLCGDGPLKPLVEAAAARDPRIEDLGFVQPERLRRVLAGAGALVLPSHVDHWGVALLDAAAAGLPLVASTACGAADDLVEEGVNGLLVPPGDAAALATALEGLAALSGDTLRAMGAASRRVSADYTPERWADRLMERVEALVG